MLQTFPNEIHELILSHLDKSSTSNYSLTCQRTTHVAQRHLFKTVKLKFYTHLGKGQTLPERFLSFLTSSPHICGLVKSLLVRTTGWTPEFERIALDNVFPRCLSLLKNVENFGFDDYVENMDWSNLLVLVPMSSKAIQETFLTHNLVHLFITGVNDFPLSLLQDFTKLQQISLNRVNFERQDVLGFWNDYQDPPHRKPCTLKTLHLDLRHRALQFFVGWLNRSPCPLNISNLLCLSIKLHRDHLERYLIVRSILHLCANSLETLCLNILGIRDPIPLDIGILSRLRVLRLYIPSAHTSPCWYRENDLLCTRLWLSNILSSVTFLHYFEEISIKMPLIPYYGGGAPDAVAWAELGALFSQTMSCFHLASFFFLIPQADLPINVDIDKLMNDNFPTLCERGILKAKSTDVEDGFLAGEDTGFPSCIC